MSRRPAALVVIAVSLCALTACTPSPVDPAEVAQWRLDRQVEIDADGPYLAVLSSDSEAGQDGDRMQSVFGEPQSPTSITFYCYGDGTLDLHLDSSAVTGASTTTTSAVETIDCTAGPHEMDPTSLGADPIDLLGIATTKASRDTAWFLTVRSA
ncbi:hypothetical protein [Rathayibacter sp. AY1D3]|uniref:hypothetical protein n=2 Tax=unclassified Rathayibacter TaxID=2609250 RepID=UPI0011AFEFF6|nr:hypothetical protein [Rathayibacter sp. AY1D3]